MKMDNLLGSLYAIWIQKVNPKIASFITFFGLFGLSTSLVIAFLLAKLSEEVLEKEAFALDKAILFDIHRLANPFLDQIMLNITQIGDPKSVVSVAFAVLLFLCWRRYHAEAAFFLLSALGGAILSYGLKLAFSKPRPQLWPQLISEQTFSYPSGHALGSMVIYGSLAYLLSSLYPRCKKIFYSVAICLITSIGFSRLYLGVHWPTDIVAGYGVGFLWVTTCIMLLRLHQFHSVAREVTA